MGDFWSDFFGGGSKGDFGGGKSGGGGSGRDPIGTVQKVSLSENGLTQTYFGPFRVDTGNSRDSGPDHHGHVGADDAGNVKYEREVGEAKGHWRK